MKFDIDIRTSARNAGLSLFMLMYGMFIPGLMTLILALTPVLWDPATWTIFWDSVLSAAGAPPGWVDFEDIFAARARCMNYNETVAAIAAPPSEVSGFYGPGAYLAWFIAAWSVAISSIAHAKCSADNPERLKIDLELLGVVAYPLVAIFDVIVRLCRCRIDPELTAAVFVILSSLTILSATKRLSVQSPDPEDLFEITESLRSFFENKRLLTMRAARWLGYGITMSISGEPYINRAALITSWAVSFVVLVYSGVVSNSHYIKGHRQPAKFRPWKERVFVFCLGQAVFSVVLVTTGARSFWPASSAHMTDLDQVAALTTTVASLVIARSHLLKKAVQRWIRRLRLMGKDRASEVGTELEALGSVIIR